MTKSMLEEQATHICGAWQDQEQQNRWTSARDSQVVTKLISKWTKVKPVCSPWTKSNEKH